MAEEGGASPVGDVEHVAGHMSWAHGPRPRVPLSGVRIAKLRLEKNSCNFLM